MAKATVVAVYLAFVFILSVSSQTPSEIKDQVSKIRAIADAYDAFNKALEVNTDDVDHFKGAVQRLLPAIKTLRRTTLFAKTYFDDADPTKKLVPVKDALREMNARYLKLDVGLDQLQQINSEHINQIINWYKEKRAPTGYVEFYAKHFASASSSKDYVYYLEGLRLECANSDPLKYFTDRQRGSNHPMSVSALSGGYDRSRLVMWAKVIAADATRAMVMSQACLGVKIPSPSQSQSDKSVDNAWAKLREIFADLKKESERLKREWDTQLLPDVNAQLEKYGSESDVQLKLANYLTAKYNWVYFGVIVLNAEFDKTVFHAERALEVPLGEKTLVIFWLNKDNYSKARQDQIKAYLDSVDCVRPSDAKYFRSELMSEVEEVLRGKGATAVYVTDNNIASRAWPQVSFVSMKSCDGEEEWPQKKHWKYTRTIIVGY